MVLRDSYLPRDNTHGYNVYGIDTLLEPKPEIASSLLSSFSSTATHWLFAFPTAVWAAPEVDLARLTVDGFRDLRFSYCSPSPAHVYTTHPSTGRASSAQGCLGFFGDKLTKAVLE